jgi:hypothetical protein
MIHPLSGIELPEFMCPNLLDYFAGNLFIGLLGCH